MQRLQNKMNKDGRWDSAIDRIEIKYGLHLDATEITRYTRAIASLNDRYGWHLDAQKVLSKLGKKLGKKCGGGWISPEKRCKSHYTNGKLNEAGKASGENLADRIRQRKKLATVSRNGKGKELSYAFLPGNQKQSSMMARKTRAPKTGYETPGRLSNVSSTEERRSMVGLGRNPGMRSKPDTAPIMDIPMNRSAAPIASRTRKLNAESDRIAERYPLNPNAAQLRAASQEGDRTMAGSGDMSEAYRSSKVSNPGGRRKSKMLDPTQTPVRIPNQRSSNEPRKRGRSVD